MPKTGEGHQHLLTVCELHTRMHFAIPLKRRSQASKALLDVIAHVTAHTAQKVARVRCDNANEFLTLNVLDLGRRHGFNVDPTVAYSPRR